METQLEAAPIRIQRRRTKGFNLQSQSPDGRPVVSVCRPSKWGNPFYVGLNGTTAECVQKFREWLLDEYYYTVANRPIHLEDVRRELAGKHLACFCSLDQPCHADVLLEYANRVGSAPTIEKKGPAACQ